jgi:hypothetical protein
MQDVRHNLGSYLGYYLTISFRALLVTSCTLLSNKSDDNVHITQNHTTAIIVTLDATCW